MQDDSNEPAPSTFEWPLYHSIGVVLPAIAIVAVSRHITPMDPGPPASFGNILQPLIWLATVAVVAVGLLVYLICFVTATVGQGRTARKSTFIVAFVLLLLSWAQLFFGVFGPNL